MSDYLDFQDELVRGRARLMKFRVKNEDTLVNLNITSYTAFRFTGKDSARDADVAEVFTKTLSSGITKADAANGLIQVTLGASDLTALPAGEEVHLLAELQCVADDGLPYSLARGRLTVLPEISRATP